MNSPTSKVAVELFQAHAQRAEEIALDMCWKYRLSGSLFYMEEAKSEALMALWLACVEFDPYGQTFTRAQGKDPYGSFWMWAAQRIRGRIIDWFRSYHLIKRLQEGEQYSMPYHERFLSMTRSKQSARYLSYRAGGRSGIGTGLSDVSNDFDECLPSKDCADGYNEIELRRLLVGTLIRYAGLSAEELRVIALAYGPDEFGDQDVAALTGYGLPLTQELRASALHKLQLAGREIVRRYLPKSASGWQATGTNFLLTSSYGHAS
jgi:hypothetical protein